MRVGSALLTVEPDFLVQEGECCRVEHAHATFACRFLASGVEAHLFPSPSLCISSTRAMCSGRSVTPSPRSARLFSIWTVPPCGNSDTPSTGEQLPLTFRTWPNSLGSSVDRGAQNHPCRDPTPRSPRPEGIRRLPFQSGPAGSPFCRPLAWRDSRRSLKPHRCPPHPRPAPLGAPARPDTVRLAGVAQRVQYADRRNHA